MNDDYDIGDDTAATRHLYADGSTAETRAKVGIDDATDRAHLIIHIDPQQARRLMRELAMWNEHNAGSRVIFSFQVVGWLATSNTRRVVGAVKHREGA